MREKLENIKVPEWSDIEKEASRALQDKIESIEVPKWSDEEKKNVEKSTWKEGSYDNAITGVLDGLTIAFVDLASKVSDAGKNLAKNFGKTGLGKVVVGVGKNIADGTTSIFEGLKTGGEYLWDGLSDSMIGTGVIDTFNVLKKSVGSIISIYKSAGKVVVNFYEAFQSDDVEAIMSEGLSSDGTSTTDQQNVMTDMVSGILGDSPVGMIFSLMNDINDGILESFLDSLPTFVKAGMDMIVSLIEGVGDALPTLLGMIPDMITEIVGYLTNEDALNTIINGLLDMVVQIALALPDIMVALIDAIPTIIISIIDALLSNAGQFAKVGVILAVSLVDGLINTVIAGVNALIELINKVIPYTKWDIPLITYSSDFASSVSNAMGYADGGYPMQGEMFIAREAGAELVGNIGGRTGVMNNDQIIESVSQGVYEAVSQAMSDTSSNNATVINLDGKRVSERLDVASRTRGNTYGMGGF